MALVTVVGGTLADPGPVLRRNLTRMFTEGSALLESRIKPRVPIGVTEAGRGSIASEVRQDGGPVGLPIAVVGTPLRHVQVLNDGRRPGQRPPPAESLELWVRRNVRIERVHKTGRKAGQAKTRKGKVLTRRTTEAESRSLAFVIARAIGVRGLKAQRFFEEEIQGSERALAGIFAEGGMQITVDLTRGKGGA